MEANFSEILSTGTLKPGSFWGKYFRGNGQWLPLTIHCLDVAMVFQALCALPSYRRALNMTSGMAAITDEQIDRLAVLAMLHDAGKANLGFQCKVFDPKLPQAGHIRELAPILDLEVCDEELHMAFITALPSELFDWFPDEEAAYSFLMAVFSHHGQPLMFRGETLGVYRLAKSKWWRRSGEWDPMAAVSDISKASRLVFPQAFSPSVPPLPSKPQFHHRFAGILTLADWIGSHPEWFPIQEISLAERVQHNRRIIPDVFKAIGLDIAIPRQLATQGPQTFQARFHFHPKPLQAAIDKLSPAQPNAQLVIAESETGSGKTEAALNWFYKLFASGKVDGLYFALPTRVAARGLYERIHNAIERWFPDPQKRPVTVLAVPGYAQVDKIPIKAMLLDDKSANRWQDDQKLTRRERMWAAEHPKRFLASTIAIGTIDQALLSIVQTAHAHLRSVCLDRSLLVVDEVHASDYYMTRILRSLLKHHFSIGGYAMLLSATLGSSARIEYLQAAGCHDEPPSVSDAAATPYPAITLGDGTLIFAEANDRSNKQVRFELLPYAFRPEAILDELLAAVRSQARVIIIMNTVDRAVQLLRFLESHPEIKSEYLFHCRDVTCPHHGRFSPQDRVVLDAAVNERLGPSSPGGPLIMIGTQTLEQSLDIDADLMITDLAPADVLLQRVGRLHRHQRERPPGYEVPRCLVLTTPEPLENALDHRGNVLGVYKRIGYGSVYEDLRTLELTVRVLAEKGEVSIPKDNRCLVESVTHPDQLDSLSSERWQRHAQIIQGGDLAKAIAAGSVIADFGVYFGQFEFNESGGKVAVRLGADTLQLPLSHPIFSPFDEKISEMLIPGHLAPSDPEEVITVEAVQPDAALLRCGDRHYRYSRYGLEAMS